MFQLVPKDLNWDFIGKWKIATVFSLALVGFAVQQWVSLGDSKFGTDFKGGHGLIVEVSKEVTSDQLRAALEAESLKDPLVQSFKSGAVGTEGKDEYTQFAIRMGSNEETPDTAKVKAQVAGVLSKVSPGHSEILQADFVGPTIGQEMRSRALLATFIGVLGLLIYITFRFEFAFALGAVVAVFHDVIIATGLYLFAGHPLNMGYIAAALTILGYSVNDTIVIFDRVREELRNPAHRDLTLSELINLCINRCMSRTIITSMLTLFSVAALLVFGGGAIQDLSFFLFVGILCGSYSTIYIASPVVIAWEWWRRSRSPVAVSTNS